ncbi:MAG: hypothetical protein HAW67_07240 [Endozoicomonadaceae bacterium]|nr:hypothetical protein [Endozoicomonadaceae bacterium]
MNAQTYTSLFLLAQIFVSLTVGAENTVPHSNASNVHPVSSDAERLWPNGRLKEDLVQDEYITDMHQKFSSIKANYDESGAYYYRDGVNSFGEREAINTQEEVIFCSGSDVNFTNTMINTLKNDGSEYSGQLKQDSTSFGRSLGEMEGSIELALVNNSTASAKGRFCYKQTNSSVSYRTAGAESAVYCPQGTTIASYIDPVSQKVCSLQLDIDLKVGEVRFIRQLQGGTQLTIAQGYVNCSRNFNGNPNLELVANGQGCSSTDRRNCNYSCDWAHKVACASSRMPAWGGGKCKARPTTIFIGENLSVLSDYNLSERNQTDYWEGNAQLACNLIGSAPEWVVTSQSCSRVNRE